jgi:hypothetical protein
VSFPNHYLGYTRWMLVDVLHSDRARVGHGGAELRMMARVIAAVAASTLAKLAIEPWLVADLERRGAGAWIDLAPLAGDLVYGPGLAYAVLAIGARLSSKPAVTPVAAAGSRPPAG